MIKDNPWLGSGLGSWPHNIYAEHYGTWNTLHVQRAHNDLLELITELGILGLLLLIAVVVALLLSMTRILRKMDIEGRWFYWLVFVSLSGSALNMMFSFSYQNAVPLVLFGFYAALLIKASDPYNPAIKTLIWRIKPTQCLIVPVLTTLACTPVIVIYMEWIQAYKQIDMISRQIDNNTFNSAQLAALNTRVYHSEIPTLMYAVGTELEKKRKYHGAQLVWDEMLRYSPNNFRALTRSAESLTHLKQYNTALARLDQARRAAPTGEYAATIEAIKIHDKIGHTATAKNLYNQLSQEPEQDLSQKRVTYAFLHQKSIDWRLSEETRHWYQQYHKFHRANCLVDNNMLAYYLSDNQSETALRMGRKLLREQPDCVSKWVLQQLKNLGSSL